MNSKLNQQDIDRVSSFLKKKSEEYDFAELNATVKISAGRPPMLILTVSEKIITGGAGNHERYKI